jgi:serine/threonine protein phosphatase PrpC
MNTGTLTLSLPDIKLKQKQKQKKLFNIALQQQESSRQDYILNGVNARFKWLVAIDGHGHGHGPTQTNNVLDCLKNIEWAELIDQATPQKIYASLKIYMESLGDTLQCGAAISIVKIFPEYIECMWLGDATIAIYKNGLPVFRSADHNGHNLAEIARLKEMQIVKEPSWDLHVLDADTITMVPSSYFLFGPINNESIKTYAKINLTHALGHNSLTGDFIAHHTEIFANAGGGANAAGGGGANAAGDYYKVVMGSDGFWKMMAEQDKDTAFIAQADSGAPELLALAAERWQKKWNYLHPPPSQPNLAAMNKKNIKLDKRVYTYNTSIPAADDICVGVWADIV